MYESTPKRIKRFGNWLYATEVAIFLLTATGASMLFAPNLLGTIAIWLGLFSSLSALYNRIQRPIMHWYLKRIDPGMSFLIAVREEFAQKD